MAGSNLAEWIRPHSLEACTILDMEALMQSELGVKWIESKSQFEQLKYMKALLHANAAALGAKNPRRKRCRECREVDYRSYSRRTAAKCYNKR